MNKKKYRKVSNDSINTLKGKCFFLRVIAISFTILWGVSVGLEAQTAPSAITGKVVDSSNDPLSGATIVKKGTQIVAVTSENGEFRLPLAAGESLPTLVVSYLGFKKKEIKLSNHAPLTIVLEEDVTELGEFVVTGIFNKAKESYTGAANQILAEELKISGNRNIISSIRNIDPSLNIADNVNIGSDPNKLPTITIRGNSSLPTDVRDLQTATENMQRANQPLIVLNGFEVSLERLMDMDENMVESITLLKDANATAMYGTRGSNGVIVITTKTPKSGRLMLTYKGNVNIEAPDLTSYNLMNAREKLAYEWAAGLYETTHAIEDQELKDLYNLRKLDVERGVDTYWLKYPVRTGVGSRHSLSIEGGDDIFKYSANLSYNNISGAMKGSSRNTYSGGMTFTYKVQNFTFKNDLQIIQNNSTNSPYGTFSDFGKVNSYWKPYDDEGNLVKVLEDYRYNSLSSGSSNKKYNPLWNALLPSKSTSEYLQILDNFSIEWHITSALFLRGQLGITAQRNRSDSYISANHTMFDSYTGEDYKRRGRYTLGTGNSKRYEGQMTLNYSKTFNEVHQLFAGAGANISESSAESYSVTGEGISMPTMDYLPSAQQYLKDGRPGGSESIVRNAGFLANANYTFNRRYFVDVNGKLEGSSQFGANKRLAPFWSGGIGWNIHHENFLKDNPIVNVARIRLSYGVTGSQEFASYLAISTYKDFGGLSYQGQNGVDLMALGNPDLGWQKTYQYNLGTELQLFNSRLRLNADFYNKLAENVLARVNLPTAGGFENYMANIGEVENKGFELSANVFVLKNTQGLTWSVGGTMIHNVNTIKKISNALEALNKELMEMNNSDSRSISPSFLYKEGESINTIYAVRSKGIDPGTGREVYIKADGSETFDWSARDQVPCGNTDHKLNGTINTNLRYKGINLGAYFYYRYGGQVYNDALAGKVENIRPYDNADRRAYYDRWKSPGDVVFFKSVRDFSTTQATSRFIMDNNTFAFQSLSLGYDLPKVWIKSIGAQYLNITGYLEDVLYLSTVKRERGLSYPFSRKFSVSLTARF